jgi:regulator of replication initiation timing
VLSPKTLLPILIGTAVGAGGVFQGLQWRTMGGPTGDVGGLENQLRIATEENNILRRENDSLRSLAQGGGEVAVPQELVDRVEKEFGLRFKSSPVVHRISTDDLRERISASFESAYGPGGLDYRQEAYGLIGWLMPEDKLLVQLTAVRSVGARGWFDGETGEGWLTDRFQMDNIPDQAALLRVVVRILLHQNFPPPSEYPGDDTARAREALHQGAASASEAKYYAEQARMSGFIPMADTSETERVMDQLSPFIQELTMFPLTDGAVYVNALKGQSKEKLVEAFQNPPRTTQAILTPGSEGKEPDPLEMPAVEMEPFMSDRAGELGLRLWLEPLGDAGAALEISSAWKNDRYLFFPESETQSAVVWDMVMESKEAADKFQEAALNHVSATAMKDDTAALDEPVESLNKRFLMVSRVGQDRVRFINSAKKETASELKGSGAP